MLKLILAVSADGYLARGPEDNMEWTGATDKKLFRLLTSVGAVCGVGRRTWEQLPDLSGRHVVPLSEGKGLVHKLKDRAGAHPAQSMSLGGFVHAHPNAWLLGGPTVAMAALDMCMVDQVYLCRATSVVLHGEQPAFKALYRDDVSPWLMSRGEAGNVGVPWSRRQRIQFDGTTVDVWSRMDACRGS